MPTTWQNVIFINYGKVRSDILASVLKADERAIRFEAERLGLGGIAYEANWRKWGYVSLIRNNWHFCSLRQIAMLLEITSEELNTILIEHDFLLVKLGSVKPDTGDVFYAPLTEEQIAATDAIRSETKLEYIPLQSMPFDFKFKQAGANAGRAARASGERIVYPYAAVYGDTLLSGDTESYPDEMLTALAYHGITGLWMPAMLFQLARNRLTEGTDGKYTVRRRNLNKLCKKCAAHGIKIYLYFNEPRSLKSECVPERLRGHTRNGFTSFCLDDGSVEVGLAEATEELCRAVPLLGGIITITMSENLTHCFSSGATNCSRCKGKQPQRLAAAVNNAIAEGARRAGGRVKVIANLWGWSYFMGWTDGMIEEGIDLLDRDVEIMLISEYGKSVCKGGVESTVIDYSISNVGPSACSEKMLAYAASKGRKIWAKIQVNNSWECSAAPALPVYGLVAEHLNRLEKLGVENYMLSWTLGGYPSLGLRLSTEYYGRGGVDLKRFYTDVFGKRAEQAARAVNRLCKAFAEFPFSLNTLYYGPHTMGGGEYWSLNKTDLEATMVGFSYDNIAKYSEPFGYNVYIAQMRKLVRGFRRGVKMLTQSEKENLPAAEAAVFAECAYLHFYSALNHAEFTLEKLGGFPDGAKAARIVQAEIGAVRALYRLQCRDARIGFEASNQYYYNENTLLAKLVNLKGIKRELDRMRAEKGAAARGNG